MPGIMDDPYERPGMRLTKAGPGLLDRAAWRFVGFCAGMASFYRWLRIKG